MKIMTIAMAIAGSACAELHMDFFQKGNDPASTVVQIRGAGASPIDLSGALTATASGTANPGIDPLNNSFTSGNSSGRIYINVQAASSFSASANSWDVDTTDALMSTKESGWGVYTNGASNVDGVRNPQALLLTMDLSEFTLGAGDSLVLKSVSASGNSTRIWQKTDTGGVEVSAGTTWAPSMVLDPTAPAGAYTFAMASNNNNQTFLTGMVFDVIPEPATIGLLGFAGATMLVARRRLRP